MQLRTKCITQHNSALPFRMIPVFIYGLALHVGTRHTVTEIIWCQGWASPTAFFASVRKYVYRRGI